MIYGEHQFSEPEASHLKALAKEAISSKSTIYQLKNDLEKARQDAHAWKSRYEKIKVQFDTLKEQVKGYLAALERAPERVMTLIGCSELPRNRLNWRETGLSNSRKNTKTALDTGCQIIP